MRRGAVMHSCTRREAPCALGLPGLCRLCQHVPAAAAATMMCCRLHVRRERTLLSSVVYLPSCPPQLG